MPRVVGTHDDLFKRSTELGGHRRAHRSAGVLRRRSALKNTGVNHGGTTGTSGPRRAAPVPRHAAAASCRSPRCATTSTATASGCAPVPGTDVAIMLALAHVLATESLADRDFLGTYCTGYDRFERYLLGADDGVPEVAAVGRRRSAACRPTRLRALARRMAAGRTLVTVSWSLQRVAARRAGSVDGADAGGDARPDRPSRRRFRPRLRLDERTGPAAAALPAAGASRRGPTRSQTFIPVAAVSDMLLHPGEPFDYNGRRLTYPGHQAASTGPAATRSTTTRTCPGCGARWPASTPSWYTTRTGRRWPSTPTSSCRRPRPTNATTSPAHATTRC